MNEQITKEQIAELLDGVVRKLDESAQKQSERESALAELRARTEDTRTTELLEEIRDLLIDLAPAIADIRNSLGG